MLPVPVAELDTTMDVLFCVVGPLPVPELRMIGVLVFAVVGMLPVPVPEVETIGVLILGVLTTVPLGIGVLVLGTVELAAGAVVGFDDVRTVPVEAVPVKLAGVEAVPEDVVTGLLDVATPEEPTGVDIEVTSELELKSLEELTGVDFVTLPDETGDTLDELAGGDFVTLAELAGVLLQGVVTAAPLEGLLTGVLFFEVFTVPLEAEVIPFGDVTTDPLEAEVSAGMVL